jgi:hypothetical protein
MWIFTVNTDTNVSTDWGLRGMDTPVPKTQNQMALQVVKGSLPALVLDKVITRHMIQPSDPTYEMKNILTERNCVFTGCLLHEISINGFLVHTSEYIIVLFISGQVYAHESGPIPQQKHVKSYLSNELQPTSESSRQFIFLSLFLITFKINVY